MTSRIAILLGRSLVLSLLPAVTSVAQVSGINGKIVFMTDRDGDSDIYAMNADGSNQIDRAPSISSDETPGWSPDGRQIHFFSDRDGGGNTDLWVMGANGANLRRVSNMGGVENAGDWSPDGESIAVTSNQDGDTDVFIIDVATGARTKLTFNGVIDGHPEFSPDGSKIAFFRQTGAALNDLDIFVMNSDGSNAVNLTNRVSPDITPAWSPAGKFITFATNRDGNHEIYRMDAADGGNQVNLTNSPGTDIHSHWSPDGKKIVFDSNRDGDSESFVMDADGSNVAQLTDNIAEDSFPRWQPVHKCRR